MDINPAFFADIGTETLLDIYTRMIRIRFFEEQVVELFNQKRITCPVHLYVGQEGVAAGVCVNLTSADYAVSTHRSHGHYLAKGGSPRRLMAEILCRDDGCSRGHGGSMHVTDPEAGFLASSAIVAGTIPIAVGAALKIKLNGDDRVSVAFFGDGATDEGVFYESVNFACLYKLPVLFVCENNLFSTHMPIGMRQSNQDLARKMAAFNLETRRVDGNNAGEVYGAARTMLANARAGVGPAFLECMTYRWYSHVGVWRDLDVGFRTKADVEYWMNRCPIRALREYLVNQVGVGAPACDAREAAVRSEIADCISFALASPLPTEESMSFGLYTER
jgi:TPP-dependent pyruvate/acetoin dehydrogenase alpha subunit